MAYVPLVIFESTLLSPPHHMGVLRLGWLLQFHFHLPPGLRYRPTVRRGGAEAARAGRWGGAEGGAQAADPIILISFPDYTNILFASKG